MGVELIGKIFNIQHFSIHDGPGIRTNVFFKGCPLRCKWCHNPESWEIAPELSYNAEKCVKCGACFKACANGGHSFTKDGENVVHEVNRSECVKCGACVKSCYYNVLDMIGKDYTVDEVLKDVLSDKPFYDAGDGGITLSGGEPFMQFDFALELLRRSKEAEMNTCVETSGFCSWEKLEQAAEFTDLFLYDFKETVSELHKEFTGVGNELILSNLHKLDESGKKTVLRCPVIPDMNARPEHFKGIADLANSLNNLVEINIEPYHPLGISKSANIGKEPAYCRREFIDKEVLKSYHEEIMKMTDKKVVLM